MIEEVPEKRVQSNLVGTAAILAGLVLKEEVIKTILSEEVMRESVIYQEILRTGFQRGRLEGREETQEEIARALMRENMSLEQVARLTGLTIEKLESIRDSVDNN